MTTALFELLLVCVGCMLVVIATAHRYRKPQSCVNHVTQEMHLAVLEKVRNDLEAERARADREHDRADGFRMIAKQCLLRQEPRQSVHR